MLNSENKWRLSPSDVLRTCPILPVLVIQRPERAVPLARALLDGGISILEITLRTEAALEAISAIRMAVPEALVGAGTVVGAEDIYAIEKVGASFAVSPGLTPSLLESAKKATIPLIPGISTVSELMVGLEAGFSQFKFFPAECMGGVSTLKAMKGPFPHATFCPTGGINGENFLHYLSLENVVCVDGSWLAPQELVEQGRFDEITALARDALSRAQVQLEGM